VCGAGLSRKLKEGELSRKLREVELSRKWREVELSTVDEMISRKLLQVERGGGGGR